MHPRERPHRLPESAYIGRVKVAITCAIARRIPVFNDPRVFQETLDRLLSACGKESVDVLLYCFMPDHLHAILQGRHEASNLLNAMKRFKQSTGFWFSRQTPPIAWQGDYYDHVMRSSEDYEEHCFYILGNPVRAGLTADHFAYPFTGSGTLPLEEFFKSL